MSSDEEDSGSAYRRYRVARKPWRHPQVTAFLRVLDAMHRRWRSRAGQGSLRGAPPRLRFESTDVSTESRPVPGLPRNAYDPDWLNSLTTVQREDLHIDEQLYDFSHHVEVLA